jgi:hypothetical protein
MHRDGRVHLGEGFWQHVQVVMRHAQLDELVQLFYSAPPAKSSTSYVGGTPTSNVGVQSSAAYCVLVGPFAAQQGWPGPLPRRPTGDA